ncbi:L-lactate permease [Corynebacterium sp. H128]|uniref:L-lactate permease n=1 Tax=unclassified Corynebacterium TaxID=2624378 RepID=UPI0030ACE3E6
MYLAQSFAPATDAIGGSQVLSALAGISPLAAFFIFLMAFKLKAHTAALLSLLLAIVIAILGFRMPVDLTLLSMSEGIAFGLFPIVFIIWMAVWIYDLTVKSGRFDDLRQIFSALGRGDMRVQALLIAFSFGGLLEALAGFGAPVAIVAAMLLAIGMKPLKAALATLVANTAPVAFGAMAIPVTTAGLLAELPVKDVAAQTGILMASLALFVPLLLCLIMDGMRGLRQIWPMAIVLGLTYAAGQFVCSNYLTYELTNVVACLVSLGIGIGFLKVWAPTTPEDQASLAKSEKLSGKQITLALFPYLLVVVVFAVAKLWKLGIDIPAALAATDVKVPWPGLHGKIASNGTMFNFNWLSGPGTLLLLCGLATVLIYASADKNFTFGTGIGELFAGLNRMKFSFLTIATVMGLAYVMNFSGQTAAIGATLAATGSIFPALSPMLGWVGTAVTGSATSSNALFAKMQATTAHQIGVDPTLLVSANSGGAVTSKMISPQTVAIAAAAVKMENGEATIMRAVFGFSLGLLAFMCAFVFLLA